MSDEAKRMTVEETPVVDQGGDESGVAVQRMALPKVLDAFQDLGANRLPLAVTVRIHEAMTIVKEAAQRRADLRNVLIRQYDETGEGWADPRDAPYELVDKIEELESEDVPLNLGNAVSVERLGNDIQVSPNHYSILLALGFLETGADDHGVADRGGGAVGLGGAEGLAGRPVRGA